MGKMKEIWAMHQEGYSAEYIAEQMKLNTVVVKEILYPKGDEEE